MKVPNREAHAGWVVSAVLAAAVIGCTAEDGDQTHLVFDRSVLHRIEITVAAEHLNSLETDLDERVPCSITYDGVTVSGAGVRQKGGSGSQESLSGKPSFSVDINDVDPDAELHGLRKLILNNSLQDPTFLRENLGSDMYLAAGLPVSRRTHGIVSLNGSTLGLYVVAEAVDKRFLARTFGEYNEDGNLYEGPCCGDFVTDVSHMELKDEEEDGRSRDDLHALVEVVQTATDAEFAEEVDACMNLSGFITGYAIDAALDHWDGYSFEKLNNYYMYNNPDDDRFVFIPHGMDRILEHITFDPTTWPTARLSQRVRQIPALDAQFHAELARVINDLWDVPTLLAEIDRTAAVINTADMKEERVQKDVAAFNENASAWRDDLAARKKLLAGSADASGSDSGAGAASWAPAGRRD